MDQAIMQHPAMRQILADVEEQKRQDAIQAQQAQIEAQQHRMSTIQGLKNQITQELATYNQLAQQVRRLHGKMHILQEKLDTLLGVHSPVMPDSFLKINLPSAYPKPTDDLHPLFATGHADVLAYQQTRSWPC